jgi:hypothetical protein
MPLSLIILITLVPAVILVLALLLRFRPNLRQMVVSIGSSLGVAAAAVGVILAFFELKDSTDQHRQSVRLRRQEIAFAYMKRFEEIPDKATLRGLIDGLAEKRPAEVQSFFANQRADGMKVVNALNLFEEISIAARTSYADDATLCALLEEPAVRYYGTLKNWVVYFRQKGKAPSFLQNYEWLYGQWKDGCPVKPSE